MSRRTILQRVQGLARRAAGYARLLAPGALAARWRARKERTKTDHVLAGLSPGAGTARAG